MDVAMPRLEGHAGAAASHVERVGYSDDASFDREWRSAAAVGNDRVHRLGDHDRSLWLRVDPVEQFPELVGGHKQAERFVIDAVYRHTNAVEEAGGGDDHLRVAQLQAVV